MLFKMSSAPNKLTPVPGVHKQLQATLKNCAPQLRVKQKGVSVRIIICSLWASIFLISCSHAIKTETQINYKGHPIIGIWDYEKNGCIETYEFLPNGVRNVTSNQEEVKASYTITETKSEQGFYKLTDKVLEDNGKADCSGSKSDMTGDIVELYLSFSPSEDQLIFCIEESFDKCFGPFNKR